MKLAHVLFAAILTAVSAVQLPLYKFEDKNLWYAAVEIGAQSKYLLVDTGSPWTWTVTNSTVCYEPLIGGRTRCSTLFGTPYSPSSTLTRYNGTENEARISYADLSVVRGSYAFEDLTLAPGFSVDQAPIVLANSAVMSSIWPGSGIFGLSPELPQGDEFHATPEALALHQIPSSRQDLLLSRPQGRNTAASSQRDTVLTQIFNDTTIPAYFGLALSRATNDSFSGGLLTIGESADISDPYINATGPGGYVQVPLEPFQTSPGSTPIYVDYSTNITGITFGRNRATAEIYTFSDTEDTPFTFDSGTEINLVPNIHAALVGSRFDPPAYLDHDLWFVACDATPPAVGVAIADELFHINALDMVVRKEALNRTTVCLSAFQGDYQFRILGSPFLKNVYVETYQPEFVGEESASMWIAARESYAS